MSQTTETMVVISALMDAYQAAANEAQQRGDATTASIMLAAYTALAQVQEGLIEEPGQLCLPYSGPGNGRRIFNANDGTWNEPC